MKIQNKIIWFISIIITLVLTIGNFIFYYQTKKILYDGIDSVLLNKAAKIAEDYTDIDNDMDENSEESEDEENFFKFKDNLKSEDLYLLVMVNKKILELSNNLKNQIIDFNVKLQENAPVFFNKFLLNSKEVRWLGVKINANSYEVTMFVGLDLLTVTKNLFRIKFILLLLYPIIIIITIIGVYLSIKKGFLPINEIIRKVNSVDAAKLSIRLPALNSKDEVAELSIVFNNMLDRIENSVNTIRQFTADASHEIRNPLAVIKSTAQINLRKIRTIDEYKETLTTIEWEADYLEKLVKELLLLARLDEMKTNEHLEKIELFNFIMKIFDAYSSHLKLNLECAKNIKISVYPLLFSRIFDNFFENSVKFSGTETSAYINVLIENEKLIILYCDNGKNIKNLNIERIFDRFYQSDYARTDKKGFGLGLSIVKAIVKLHSGEISCYFEEYKGLTFKIILPNV